jgi:hypothetical protein
MLRRARPSSFHLPLLVLPAAAILLLGAPAAWAKGGQSIESCAASKLRAAAGACYQVVASSAQGKPGAGIDPALALLAKGFASADAVPLASGTACSEATGPADPVGDLLVEAAQALAAELEPTSFRGRQQVRAAATLCKELLVAEADHLLVRYSDRLREGLAEDREAAHTRFGFHFDLLTAIVGPGDGPGADEVAEAVAALAGRVLLAIAVSPQVSPDWEMIDPPALVSYEGKQLEPMCWDGAPWVFFVKRGSVNKLVMYYQGGGACWSQVTCNGIPGLAGPTFKQTTGPQDNPANATTGFANLNNPDNPFREWNQVFVPYCTGDVHWGDATVQYEMAGNAITVNHKGFVNAQVAEKWAREHFVHPEAVFVTGSSAGAYGAIVNSLYLQERAYPSAHFDVLGDAGNGVITQDFLSNDLANWGIQNNLPPWMPGLDVPLTDLQASDLYVEAAHTYPQNRFATYTTAYDGGQGGQTGFLQVMRSGPNVLFWIRWWDSSCLWNQEMLALNEAAHAEAPDNFRYYVGTGSAHTMWGRNKVYTDTTGNVPTVRDWLVSMLAGDAGWTNVVADDFGLLLAGDPRANPAFGSVAPFDLAAGRIVCP